MVINKYKICVYAICKNEEQFIDRWVDSMSEADEIYVLDTGSTDKSIELLKKRKVNVKQKIYDIWRFDVARNDALDLLPKNTDICVCTDIDEVFTKGWRKALEKKWDKKTSVAKYKINVGFDNEGNPSTSFYINKIHTRKNYKWVYPVHEILKYVAKDKEKTILCDEFELNHYPDESKSRESYLPLLKLAVEENPDDARNWHYLGREYMYKGKWNKSIDTLIKHLSHKNSTWIPERSASMRYIAKCYVALNRYEEAKLWFTKAIIENPGMREPYFDLAFLQYSKENYSVSIHLLDQALKITNPSQEYFNESSSWNGMIEDILSVCYYKLGDKVQSLKYAKEALNKSPSNKRLIENVEFIEKSMKNK